MNGPRDEIDEMMKLKLNTVNYRTLHVDDLDTLGVSTQTLAEEAIRAGRSDEAVDLVAYFHQEMRIMHGILTTWLTDISRYIVALARPRRTPPSFRPACWRPGAPILWAWRSRALQEAIAPSRPGRLGKAIDLLDQMRLEFKYPARCAGGLGAKPADRDRTALG